MKKIIFLIHDYDFFKSHRIHLAKHLKTIGYHVLIACPKPKNDDYSALENFSYHPLKLKRKGRNLINEMTALFDIFKLYKKERPDIVLHFTIKPVVYGTLIGKVLRIPKVFNVITGLGYVYTNTNFLNTITKTLIGIIYKFSMLSKRVFVIFQNPDDRNFFLENQYASHDRSIVILGSGVDTSKFSPLPEPRADPVILFAARMLRDKGILELIEACKLLDLDGIHFKLRLCGKIDYDNFSSLTEEYIKSLADQYPWIEWLGPQKDMPALLAASNVVCLPSYREGVPLTLLEAMSSGRAIVTTDAPGCRETVINQRNGILVPIKSVKELHLALKYLCLNAEVRKNMAVAGRELALEIFEISKINQSYTRLFEQ